MKEVISNTAFQAFQGFVWAQKKYRVSLPYANFVIANFDKAFSQNIPDIFS